MLNQSSNLRLLKMLLILIWTAIFWSLNGVDCKPFNFLSNGCRPEDGFFRCKSGQCVYRSAVRDTMYQCRDGSDENIDPLQCTDDEVYCRVSDRCLLRRFMNKENSCQAFESETYPCRPDEFQCHNGKNCIPRWMIMDGQEDCHTMLLNDTSDELTGFQTCLPSEFRCEESTNQASRCIPREWVMDGDKDCLNGSDEKTPFVKCYSQTEFRCKINGRCVPRYRVFDGFADCLDYSDEMQALDECLSTKEFRCKDNGRCIPRSWQGNKLINCKDRSDEVVQNKNQTCFSGEFKCHNGERCIPNELLCDGMDHCGDCSDEIESCHEPRLFRCPSQPEKCIHWDWSCDSYSDCINGTDDVTSQYGFKCQRDHVGAQRYCSIPQWMLRDEYANCDDKSDLCSGNNATSTCPHCLDGKTVIANRQICDGIVDCPDFSDECLCVEGRATNRTKPFCDKVIYTEDKKCPRQSLYCPVEDKCINPNLVCDGKPDCPVTNLDEELCAAPKIETTKDKDMDFRCDLVDEIMRSILQESALKLFYDTFAPENATRCDGKTECLNFEDECSLRANCSIRPTICDDIPLTLQWIPPGFGGPTEIHFVHIRRCNGPLNFAFGKSICNGVLECLDGIDERNCSSERFECDAGSKEWYAGTRKVVSIPLEKYCDGNVPTDCVDKSDESNCSEATHFYCENGDPMFVKRSQVLDGKQDCSDFSDECPKNIFLEGGISSREELIKSPVLQVLVWIMVIFAIFGNVMVANIIIKKILKYRRNPVHLKSKVGLCNNILIFNLSVADFLMGLVLFTIAVRSLQYKGEYCLVDKSWRTSSGCTAIGVVTVLSSQASVFTLVVITSFRLFAVLKPLESKQLPLRTVIACLFVVWSLALFIAVFPLSNFLANSMVSRVWISANPYFPSDTVSLKPFQEFTQRITALSNCNTTAPNDWYGIERHLQQNFPNLTPQVKGYFGYYSESGVCIPRLYQTSSEDAEPNPMTFVVMTINFLALVYIIMAYVAIYKRSTANTVTSTSSQAKAQKLHRKITLLIATDMACWFPLCLMSFLSMGGFILPPVSYALSAIVFLPINSSLNPIIYTNSFPFLWEWWNKSWLMVKAKLNLKTDAQPNE